MKAEAELFFDNLLYHTYRTQNKIYVSMMFRCVPTNMIMKMAIMEPGYQGDIF